MNQDDRQLPQEEVTVAHNPLELPIDDITLIATINDALIGAEEERVKRKIADRSKLANDFWAGNQVNEDAIDKRYQMAHQDNVIHPDLENRIMLAAGRSPDIILLPPDREQKNMEATRSLQQVIRERIDSNTIKRLIKDGLRNLHTDFTAVIKPVWIPHKDDYSFELVLGENVRFGKGSKVPHDGFTIDGTDILIQYVDEPLKVVLAKFPKKADELRTAVAQIAGTDKKMPSHIRYMEVQFTWYTDKGEAMQGVAWKYQNVILDKMRHPYFDYEGENNFFDVARKNFILLSYINRGKGVYEATTAVEQAIPPQRIVNKRLRQITEISDRAVPKLAFRSGAITAEMARNISNSPKEAVLVDTEGDDIRKEMTVIPAQAPNPILYNDLMATRGRIDTLMATHGTTRGESKSAESGVSKQISREGDLVTSDDLVDIVVERVVHEMVCWAIHFMRLYYRDDRKPVRMNNKNGKVDFVKTSREMIKTDVEVVVKASTNDKETLRSDALNMLKAQAIDPYTLIEDLDVPNPRERIKRLLTFQQAAAMGGDYTAYLKVIGVELEEHDDVAEQQRAQTDIAALKSGQQPPTDQPPTESYLAEFIKFVNSAEFDQLDPQVQSMIQQFIAEMKQRVASGELEQGGQPSPATGQAPTAQGVMGQPQASQQPAAPDQQQAIMAAMQQRAAA